MIQFADACDRLTTTNTEICHNKPCIRGLRIPQVIILRLLETGVSHEEILFDYPVLSKDDLESLIGAFSQTGKVMERSALA